ncbi:nucleoside deaminase [Endozoicomonas sp. G2_2]|uniref:nucleoside deaminase n=1 Tax=Endozoicomonas sp. G2_2 TaxID=2821092 RepID=UPI001ADAD9BE|nr:nucleoside deaminase [Endozoicomonas sp. G2_2]MBO9469329.1 nucleoside deaminase [Endozoicomonas sp. G2_2]
MDDERFMAEAVAQARKGRDEGGVPIGCVLVKDGAIVGAGHNRRVQNDSAILHAEMDALETTGRRPGAFYKDVTLYTTLSPCAMCSGAILLYGIPHVVIGENASFMGEEALLAERGVSVRVLDDPACRTLMETFVAERPDLWHEDIGR